MWTVPLTDLRVDDELVGAAAAAIASGWWSMGPRVEQFEAAFAAFTGSAHAIAVSSGTAALELALLATGCGSGDEVVLPSLNFVAAANVVAHTGAHPVFCDIRSDSDLNVDPDDLEAAIGPNTRALLVLHYGGHCCDMDAVDEIARRHDLVVVEDAAHAPGATWRGRMCGTLGRVGCFSFFANKNLPIGEGGMVVTDDDEVASRIRLLRSHGMTTLTWERHQGHAHTYDVVARGFNHRLDETRAAVGLVQLGRLEAGNQARGRIARRYRDALHGTLGITVPFAERPGATSAHHLAVAVLPHRGSRDPVRESLKAAGIQTSVHYPPIHRFTEYRESSKRRLPVTDDVGDRVITLPLYPELADEHVDLVIETLLAALEDAES